MYKKLGEKYYKKKGVVKVIQVMNDPTICPGQKCQNNLPNYLLLK